jgi:hypothetical protein
MSLSTLGKYVNNSPTMLRNTSARERLNTLHEKFETEELSDNSPGPKKNMAHKAREVLTNIINQNQGGSFGQDFTESITEEEK